MPTQKRTRRNTGRKKPAKKSHKYIFVVGGVMSGVGKGIATASMGVALQSKGFVVNLMKADPYLNVDAGTMNPTEHGEVFVLSNGLETDQDMGNYERFLGKSLPAENYMTNGMVFKYVIDKERALGYDGKCVEPVFHISEEILRRIARSVEETNPDITIVEIGGTIGEYQNAIFIEAARILKLRHPQDVAFVLVSYLPVPNNIGEMKTKPTQNAVRQLNSYGVNPDVIIARSEIALDEKRKQKIADASGLPVKSVIAAPDIASIYDVPVNFEKEGLSDRILSLFNLSSRKESLSDWRVMVKNMHATMAGKQSVRIAMVGKYFSTGDFVLSDAYISVIEALKTAGYDKRVRVEFSWIDSRQFEGDPKTVAKNLKELSAYDGILVPGGFGKTGIEGKIAAIRYARENNIPYLGLCYGMQLAVIEYARSVAGLAGAHTTEVDQATPHPVVAVMEAQKEKLERGNYGGSMRLGAYPAHLEKGSRAHALYGSNVIEERHRHRYEVNPEYVPVLESAGLVFSGKSPDGELAEILELPKRVHPFFMATQFHPEFLSRPLSPHPLFAGFIEAGKARAKSKAKKRS